MTNGTRIYGDVLDFEKVVARGLWVQMVNENPYESPQTDAPVDFSAESNDQTYQKSRIRPLVLVPLAGLFLGSVILATHVRRPGDPSGRSIGAGMGGLIALFILLAARVVVRFVGYSSDPLAETHKPADDT